MAQRERRVNAPNNAKIPSVGQLATDSSLVQKVKRGIAPRLVSCRNSGASCRRGNRSELEARLDSWRAGHAESGLRPRRLGCRGTLRKTRRTQVARAVPRTDANLALHKNLTHRGWSNSRESSHPKNNPSLWIRLWAADSANHTFRLGKRNEVVDFVIGYLEAAWLLGGNQWK